MCSKSIRTLAFAALFGVAAAHSANAATSINYGNFNVAGVVFGNVTESSGTDAVPLYGAPTTFVTGLDFNPAGFVAFSSGGGADITDGQLNFTVSRATGIGSISLAEAGDYTLVGSGTAATLASAGANIAIKILEIDGVAVTPFSISGNNASASYNLLANPGIVQPWAIGVSTNILTQLANYNPRIGATKIEVVIDNSLIAISQPSSVASISKKDFTVSIPVPEPTSLTAGLAFMGLMIRRRLK